MSSLTAAEPVEMVVVRIGVFDDDIHQKQWHQHWSEGAGLARKDSRIRTEIEGMVAAASVIAELAAVVVWCSNLEE